MIDFSVPKQWCGKESKWKEQNGWKSRNDRLKGMSYTELGENTT